ncbi:MAG: peptide chain release factor N(5)-glutamine methyltransferase [Pseudomonadota bacterium]
MSLTEKTYSDWLAWGARQLSGSPTAGLDARVLLMQAAGLDHATLIAASTDNVPQQLAAIYENHIQRRSGNEPVALIIGRQEFFGRDFEVTGDTLIPRPETEMLVEAALSGAGGGDRILDLGTGTGCLLLTLLAEMPEARGVAVDISAAALAVAKKNADNLGVAGRARFVEADFAEAPDGPFDLILSNPPYIEEGVELSASVAGFEPEMALRAGKDGLDAYRVLAPAIAERLARGGHAFLEIGTGQGGAVSQLMKSAMPDRSVRVDHDLAGHERMVAIA